MNAAEAWAKQVNVIRHIWDLAEREGLPKELGPNAAERVIGLGDAVVQHLAERERWFEHVTASWKAEEEDWIAERERVTRVIEELPPVVFASDDKEREMIAKNVVLRILQRAGAPAQGADTGRADSSVPPTAGSAPEPVEALVERLRKLGLHHERDLCNAAADRLAELQETLSLRTDWNASEVEELAERAEAAERERDGQREEKQIARDSAAANVELLRVAETQRDELVEALEQIMSRSNREGPSWVCDSSRAALAKVEEAQ